MPRSLDGGSGKPRGSIAPLARLKPRSSLTETPPQLEYRLLTEFRRLFEGKVYKHRSSNQGDFVAMHLYEDLININRSPKLKDATINRKDRVLNVQNRRRGVSARRGDGTFGQLIPAETTIT